MKIKDETGKEVEVFTQEDLDKKLDEQKTSLADEHKKSLDEATKKAIDEYKEKNPDKTEELSKLQKDLDDANKKLEDAGGGDEEDNNDSEQVKRLRKERDDAKKELDDFKTDVQKQIDDIKSGSFNDIKTNALNRLAGDDKELREKIELEFDNYMPDKKSKSEVVDRMAKAYQLATGDAPKPNFMDLVSGGGSERGSSETSKETSKDQATENEKEIGNKLGVSEKDREKYRDKEPQLSPPEQAV